MSRSRPKGVSPRLLAAALVVILAVGVVVLLLSLPEAPPEGVGLRAASDDATQTITYAGRFPAIEQPALANPLGMDSDGERVFVAESDAGVVAVFTLDGGRYPDVAVPPAEGRSEAYILDIAVIDADAIAVIDSASARVLVLSTGTEPELLAVVGDGSTAAGQPTALAFAEGELYVADGETGAVMVYAEADWELSRSIGAELEPSLTYPGGLFLGEDGLHVSDSNAGRIIVIDPQTGELVRILPDRYDLPRGVVAGLGGGEFVADTFAAVALALGPDGARLFGTDDVSDAEAALASPRDLCWIESDGRLYVSDAEAGEVVVFNIRTAADPD